jgi:S1-C subfamily serine protease
MDETSTQPDIQLKKWRRAIPLIKEYVRRALPFVAGMFATLAALILYTVLVPEPVPLTLDEVNKSVAEAMASATPAPAYSSIAYQAVLPSLVFIQVHTSDGKITIESEENREEGNATNPPNDNGNGETPGSGAENGAEEVPEGSGDAQGEEINGLGSGVVINLDGEVLTSLHVVTNATTIELTFADGTTSPAQIVAAQPEKDIAVLRPARLPAVLIPAVLGNPHAMNIGDEAYAVGHPFGLYASMTTGVISGFERTFRVQNSDQRIEGLIQIDAAVNPGNSGGPLLNRYGQVIGIVTGLANPTDQSFFVGIGFAVPIDVAGGAAGLPPY